MEKEGRNEQRKGGRKNKKDGWQESKEGRKKRERKGRKWRERTMKERSKKWSLKFLIEEQVRFKKNKELLNSF